MSAAASAVLGLLEEVGGTSPGAHAVVCIDGRAGTGKSTLAAELAAAEGGFVVHTDDLCPGWDGLPRVPGILADLLEPISRGEPGRYRRYDWNAGSLAELVEVRPGGLLVVEGLGAGSRALRPWRTLLVWLETPLETRRKRALDRDGDTFAPYWDIWAAAEDAYLAGAADRDRADLILRT